MSKYAELDALLLESIRTGRDTFGSLCRGSTGELADKLAVEFGLPCCSGDRVVDRRLQSLRKRGLISFSRSRWCLAE